MKTGQLVSLNGNKTYWVVIEITQAMLDNGCLSVAHPGWFVFTGLAMGQNPLDPANYSFYRQLTVDSDQLHVHGDVHAYPAVMLHTMLALKKDVLDDLHKS